MYGSYSRSTYSTGATTSRGREGATLRERYSSTSGTTRAPRAAETIGAKDDRVKEEEIGSDSETTYADLRSKLRTLQREVTLTTTKLESVSREKEDITVALTRVKREKDKAAAENEAIERERDALERENRRIKAKLETSAKELRELNDERRELSERLRASETLKRAALADDKEVKAILAKLQEDIRTLRQQNLQLEEQLANTQDQLRRARLLNSIPVAQNSLKEHAAPALQRAPISEISLNQTSESPASTTTPTSGIRTSGYNSLALAAITRDRAERLDSASNESPPNTPHTPSRSRSSTGGPLSPSVRTDAFRVEHLKVELETAKKEITKLQDTNSDLTRKLREAEAALSAAKSANRGLQSDADNAASDAKSASKRAEDAEARRKELLAENSVLKEAEVKLKAQVEQAHRDLTRARDEANAIRLQVEKAENTAKREAEAKKRVLEELAAAQQLLQGKETERMQLTRSVSKTVVDLQGSRDELSQLEVKHAKLEREVHALTTQVTHLKDLAHEKQSALDVAHNDIRMGAEKMRELSAALANAEEAQRKAVMAKKKAEDRVSELEQQMLAKEQAREAAASELEHRRKDVQLQESELNRLRSIIEFMEKSVAEAKSGQEVAQRETSEAKLYLDRVNAELQAKSLTIEQLQHDLAAQHTKLISATAHGDDTKADIELQLRLIGDQLSATQREKTEAEAKYVAAQKERDKHWTDLKTLQMELNRAKSDLQMGGRIVQDLQAKIKDAEARYSKLEEESKRLHEKQERVMDSLRGDLGNAKREIKIKDGLLADLNAKLKSATDAKVNGVQQKQEQHSQQLEADLSRVKKELENALHSLGDSQTELSSTKHRAATMAVQIQELQSTIEKQKGAIAELEKQSNKTEILIQPPESPPTPPVPDTAELDRLKRELQMSVQVAETTKEHAEKLTAELHKIKTEAAKQAKADGQLRKTLTKQCEQWQHQATEVKSLLEKVRKEMMKHQPVRTVLEPIIGVPSTSSQTVDASQVHSEQERKVITIQAYWRSALVRLRYPHFRYRYLKVKEIVDTEETYLKMLDLAWTYFIHPLQALIKLGEPIITQEELSQIFSTIDSIRKNNTEVLSLLKARFNTWHVEQTIGDVFLEVLDRKLLAPHVEFASSYSRASEARVRISKENASFSRLLSVIRMLPPMEGHSLEDLLINPIQRIPRYLLLLTDMLKHTSGAHPDYDNLVRAVQGFQEFATFINENNRRAETMSDIGARLIGYESLPENPSRKLIHEGRLISITKSEKIPRYVFLFNDYIIFGKEKEKNKRKTTSLRAGLDQKMATKFVAMIKIGPNLTVAEVGSREINNAIHPHLLNIMVGESSNLLQANSESDMKLWISRLRDTIEEAVAPPKDKFPKPDRRLSSPTPSESSASLKERSTKRLSVGTSPPKSRSGALSPERAHSFNSLPPIAAAKSLPEDSILLISSASSSTTDISAGSTATLQPSSSSGSLDGGSSRKARTLAKRHRDRAKSATPQGGE